MGKHRKVTMLIRFLILKIYLVHVYSCVLCRTFDVFKYSDVVILPHARSNHRDSLNCDNSGDIRNSITFRQVSLSYLYGARYNVSWNGSDDDKNKTKLRSDDDNDNDNDVDDDDNDDDEDDDEDDDNDAQEKHTESAPSLHHRKTQRATQRYICFLFVLMYILFF
jgi:hypothetical protein